MKIGHQKLVTLSFFYMALTVVFPSARALVTLPPNVSVPALIVFGDSIVDTGNNNNLQTLIKCNFPPYGRDFQGGIPTGRFSDGKVPSDLVAEELGIKSTVPAYLSPVTPQDLVTGVTFASGGAGYDPLTSKLVSVVSMSDQLDHFKEYIGKLQMLVGENQTNFILANSLFLIVAGSDDIANTYYTLKVRKSQYTVPAYTDLMVSYATKFVQDLHGLGARRIGLFSMPPVGCVPSQRTLAGGSKGGCAEDANNAALLFNSKMSSSMQSLNSSSHDSRIVFVDIYDAFLDMVQNPNRYGFEVADKGCCGSGNLEVAVLCNQLTPVTCSNISSHVFWDSYHPTEGAYRKLILPQLVKWLPMFF